MFHLRVLTIKTLSQKIYYILFDAIPLNHLPHITINVSRTWMNKIPFVMVFCKNILSEITYLRTKKMTLVVKHTISPFGERLNFLLMNYTLQLNKCMIIFILFLMFAIDGDSEPS